MNIVQWIGSNSNKVRMAIWQSILLGVALKWITLEEAQLAAMGMFLDAILGVFVETNTVSKTRVGERITEEVDRQVAGLPSTITPSKAQIDAALGVANDQREP
jgi:hypothetical protein